MKLTQKLAQSGKTLFSIEILPPLKGKSIQSIYDSIDPLMEFKPAFVDVTYHREEYIYKKREGGYLEKVSIRKRPGTVGICAAISPLVRFDGSAQLSQLVTNASHYSVAALIGLAFLRLIATSVALGGGYQGGNIFPSIFMAGALGLATHALFPYIPAPVAMVSFMASVMYVFNPLPLFVMFLFTEISSFSLVPVMAMSLVGGWLLSVIRTKEP